MSSVSFHVKTQSKLTFGISAAIFLWASTGISKADDKQPKYTVQEIMKAVYKGEDSIHKRIVNGKAQAADYDKLVEYLSALPLNDPPQGDTDGWKKKSSDVLAGAKALKAGEAGALARYQQAVNCQACHKIYRPE